jgi:hypothetical protein
MTALYLAHFFFLAALVGSACWLILLARVHDRD